VITDFPDLIRGFDSRLAEARGGTENNKKENKEVIKDPSRGDEIVNLHCYP
jgi:hypothetical protein